MPIQAELIQNSFSKIKQDSSNFTDEFYAILFRDYPDVEPLFNRTHMEEQGKKLFQSLSLIVQSLCHPETLVHRLKRLGNRHIQYGVLPEHYPMVGNSLLKTLELFLAEEWNIEVEKAWTQAYKTVAELMLEGES